MLNYHFNKEQKAELSFSDRRGLYLLPITVREMGPLVVEPALLVTRQRYVPSSSKVVDRIFRLGDPIMAPSYFPPPTRT